ncbi:hypothetical protein [Methylobacterium nodulans]|uniref:hypothetical protein n=1 Tax=Methylobacterium nodulans TaxID=114616 RepID=UPI0012ED3F6C|nr:hypothetical protein [Methylobacterium nodulans]
MEDEMTDKDARAEIAALNLVLAMIFRIACDRDQRRMVIALLRDAEDDLMQTGGYDIGCAVGHLRRRLSFETAFDQLSDLKREIRERAAQSPPAPRSGDHQPNEDDER